MHFPWPARQYERTCADCGYSWRVPRRFARRRFLTGPGYASSYRFGGTVAGKGGLQVAAPSNAEVRAGVGASDRQATKMTAEEAEALRACPHCSSENYSQRPAQS
jgi:hypothetical protein